LKAEVQVAPFFSLLIFLGSFVKVQPFQEPVLALWQLYGFYVLIGAYQEILLVTVRTCQTGAEVCPLREELASFS